MKITAKSSNLDITNQRKGDYQYYTKKSNQVMDGTLITIKASIHTIITILN